MDTSLSQVCATQTPSNPTLNWVYEERLECRPWRRNRFYVHLLPTRGVSTSNLRILPHTWPGNPAYLELSGDRCNHLILPESDRDVGYGINCCTDRRALGNWSGVTCFHIHTKATILMLGFSCMIVNWLNIGCAVTILLLWAVVSTLRVYAVSNRDWRLAIGTLILGLVPVMINIVYNAKTSFAPPPDLSSHFCQVITKLSPSVSNLCNLLVGHFPIFIVVTWYNTYESYQHPTRTATRTSLSRQLFRDGTLYFVLLLGMNVTQLILVLSGIFMAFGTFITMMMSVLISRFILDIRQIRIDSPEAPESIGTIFSCEERPHLVQSRLSSMIFRPSSIPCEDDHAPWMLDT
ncbi:uncharacterized protein FIBRA_03844 [Fibroporia radiculosa]|uniref:Uncharacterized protein n=1 Tax=Fibroporia radiculosa TaxID=599839 RepID=J4HW76_9APHY|nr:uncharacterized protein FIBRA_03844 [Fibroporia radiculosa]CCM01777.1 predicted protein [Fibroporia radiculosa]